MSRIFCTGALLVLLASCTESDKEGTTARLKSNLEVRNEMVAEIDSLEAVFRTDTFSLDNTTGGILLQRYQDFARMFVGDKEKTPEYMYKAAAMSRGAGLPLKAIKLYDQILKEYPEYDKCPEVAFLIGFTYDEDLKQPELAKEAYNNVVSLFPDDYWATQARYRLETIDMTDDELIEYFMKKNEASS